MALPQDQTPCDIVNDINYTPSHTLSQPPGQDPSTSEVVKHLGDLFTTLVHDLKDLLTLRIELLKMELADTAARAAKHGTRIMVAAGLGIFGVFMLNAAIFAALGGLIPVEEPYNFAVAGLALTLLYGIVALVLFKSGLKHFKAQMKLAKQQTARAKEDAAEVVGEVKAEAKGAA